MADSVLSYMLQCLLPSFVDVELYNVHASAHVWITLEVLSKDFTVKSKPTNTQGSDLEWDS